MTKLQTFIFSALAAALGFAISLPTPSQTALAQTPDGETPAEESVCDVVGPGTGSTPGLYGLCVAYCEAQDCHLDPDGEDFPQSCVNTADKLLAKYAARRDEATDPPMPCLPQTECPCWSEELLAGLTPEPPGRRCQADQSGRFALWSGKDSSGLNYRGRATTFLSGATSCTFIGGGTVISLPTTPEEHVACFDSSAAFCGL